MAPVSNGCEVRNDVSFPATLLPLALHTNFSSSIFWFSFIYHFQTSKFSPALYILQHNPAYYMMNTDDETDSSLACVSSFVYSPVPVLLGSVLESGSLYPRVIRGSSSMNGERSV